MTRAAATHAMPRPSAVSSVRSICAMVSTCASSSPGEDSVTVTATSSRTLARGGTTIGSGSLTGKSRPLDGNALVTSCNDTVNRCQNELIDSRIAASAASGDCGLIKMIGQPLIATIVGAGAGALATLWGGPTAVVGGALGGGGALVASGTAAVTQCIASRRDATSAAADLKKSQQQAASCATQ
jgi:hypothetical protein